MTIKKPEEAISEEEASQAMHELVSGGEAESIPDAPAEAEPAAGKTGAPAEVEKAPEEAAPEASEDDVESLKRRVSDMEATLQSRTDESRSRTDAIQRRFSQNEQILRDRLLRKSTSVDKALKLLKEARSESGVDPADVDRIIREMEGTMHPSSPSYQPPAADQASATEDQSIVLNSFLNEKAMSLQEADEFGKWLRGEATTELSPIEQAVAGRDLDGFLRIAHSRFDESRKNTDDNKKRADAVGAVRSVQKTQREAARAASTPASAPKKQPAGAEKEIDVRKLTKDDVSALLRQTVEQYR